jgi:hypothetical protein
MTLPWFQIVYVTFKRVDVRRYGTALAQINVEYYTCSATGDGRYVLDMDPTVECWVGWHQALWLPAMAGTLFYVIGIPLFFAATLFKHRRLLSVGLL